MSTISSPYSNYSITSRAFTVLFSLTRPTYFKFYISYTVHKFYFFSIATYSYEREFCQNHKFVCKNKLTFPALYTVAQNKPDTIKSVMISWRFIRPNFVLWCHWYDNWNSNTASFKFLTMHLMPKMFTYLHIGRVPNTRT